MMSLGISKSQESHHWKLSGFNDVEKEAIMIISNMKNGNTPPIRRPLMIQADDDIEAKEEFKTIAGVIYRINRTKSLEQKDRFIHDLECELLTEPPKEPITPPKRPLKKTRSKKTAPKRRFSARRAIVNLNLPTSPVRREKWKGKSFGTLILEALRAAKNTNHTLTTNQIAAHIEEYRLTTDMKHPALSQTIRAALMNKSRHQRKDGSWYPGLWEHCPEAGKRTGPYRLLPEGLAEDAVIPEDDEEKERP